MAEDQWSAAGFKPVRAPAPAQRGPTRSEVNRAQLRGTEAAITNAYVNAAQGNAALKQAPVNLANAASDLNVAQATEQARIKKMLAEAETAKYGAQMAALAAKYPDASATQILAAARYAGMRQGDIEYEKALKEGYQPSAMGNKFTHMLNKLPVIGDESANSIRDEKARKAALARRLFSAGMLRQETGAVAADKELLDVEDRFFGTPFSVDSRSLKDINRKARSAQISAQRRAAGPLAGDVDRELGIVPAGKPSLAQFLKDAQPKNPGVSVESLTAYYNKKYGAK